MATPPTIDLDFVSYWGRHISDACNGAAETAISMAERDRLVAVRFDFNGVDVVQEPVSPTKAGLSRAEYVEELSKDLQLQYDQKSEAKRIAYWTPERLAEEETRVAAEKLKTERRAAAIAAAAQAHPFVPIDAESYAASLAMQTDESGYGKAIFRYAEAWASLMEVELAKGATVSDVAKATSNEADVEGITGFMYGAAVSVLSGYWSRGEELRVWHNLNTQIGTEGVKANDSGGVLNPALLRLGGSP